MNCYVICLNDYPDSVVTGTDSQAQLILEERKEIYAARNPRYPGYSYPTLYWHIKEVPIFTL